MKAKSSELEDDEIRCRYGLCKHEQGSKECKMNKLSFDRKILDLLDDDEDEDEH